MSTSTSFSPPSCTNSVHPSDELCPISFLNRYLQLDSNAFPGKRLCCKTDPNLRSFPWRAFDLMKHDEISGSHRPCHLPYTQNQHDEYVQCRDLLSQTRQQPSFPQSIEVKFSSCTAGSQLSFGENDPFPSFKPGVEVPTQQPPSLLYMLQIHASCHLTSFLQMSLHLSK